MTRSKRPASPKALLTAYARLHADGELNPNGFAYKPGRPNLNQICQHAGYGCLALVNGRLEEAEREFEAAGRTLESHLERLTLRDGNNAVRVHLLRHTLGMLQKRDQPGALQAERRAMHKTVITELDARIPAANEFYRNSLPSKEYEQRRSLGIITRLTAFGLESRQPVPGRMALPTLPYQSDRPAHLGSFDYALLDTGIQKKPTAHRVETKAACLGDCETADPYRKTTGERVRSGYNPEVSIISGHCDLGFQLSPVVGQDEEHFPLAAALIHEAAGAPTAEELAALDTARDQLYLNITGSSARLGTAVL